MLFFCGTWCILLSAQDKNTAVQTLAPVKTTPVIDGNFSLKEWEHCAVDHNFTSSVDGMKSKRINSIFYGYDSKYFYFCQTSQLPPEPQKISPKDKTELLFILPGNKKISYSFSADEQNNFPAGTLFRSMESGKTQTMPGVTGRTCWLTEIALPWSAFGRKNAPDNEEFSMQVIRQWQNPEERTSVPEKGFLKLQFVKSSPMVICHSWAHDVSARLNMQLRNNSFKKQTAQVDLMIRSVEVPHTLNRKLDIQPEKTQKLTQYFMVGGAQDRHMEITVTDPVNNKTIYSRTFSWNISKGKGFHDPDPPVTMNFGYSPSQKRIIAQVTCRNGKKMADIKEIRFKVINDDKTVVSEKNAVKRLANYYDADWTLPELTLGKYLVSAEIYRKNGKKEVLTKDFFVRNFRWEYNDIGLDRSVPPPFKPLKSRGNQVHALLTGYQAGGVFWDKVFAQNKDILAAPVALYIDGKKFSKVSEKWIERSADLVVRTSEHKADGVKLEVRHEYEFDGVCKTTLKFIPDSGRKCSSLYIDIPLKEEYAKLYHHTANGIRSNPSDWIPQGKNTVWSYVRNTLRFPFYIWFGETFKGFCHFSNMTPPLFDRVKSPVTHELIRKEKSVILRLHLAKDTLLKPFEYVCGFQPTPVKPRPESARQWCGIFWNAVLPNTYMYNLMIHLKHNFTNARMGMVYTPYHNDYSFMDYIYSGKSANETTAQINARIAAFMKKHDMTNEKWQKLEFQSDSGSLSDRMRHSAIFSRNKYLTLYLNPRAGFRAWAETETYDDEWLGTGFRNSDDSLYSRRPVKSYTDKMLFEAREYLRRFPKCAGLYFDNMYPLGSFSVFHGAREISPGNYSMTGDIFTLREMMKRAVRLAAQEKRFLPGAPDYPWVEIHMTDANIIPVIGLASRALNWEMKFGRQLWQKRFPESFHYVQSLGTQAGVVPLGIVNTGGSKAERLRQHRSLYAVGFAFDMINFTDPGSREEQASPVFNNMQFLIRKFGYGTKEVEHFPGYMPEKNPVKCTPAHVRITALKHKNGNIMLLAGNLGEKAGVKLDLSRLPVKDLKNAETGKPVLNNTFELPAHDCAVLIGKWK